FERPFNMRTVAHPEEAERERVTEKGLREIVAGQTKVSDIDGAEGRLWYVGLEISDLARNATFEEVAYLLHHTRLPNRDELEELNEFLVNERELSPFLL